MALLAALPLLWARPLPAQTDAPAPSRLSAIAPRLLAPGVYALPGDSGRGAEGIPNAGFVVTREGVVAVGGVMSPRHGEALLRAIRRVTRQPVRYLVLYAHHPDMQFGAIAFRRAGARIIAHPDTRVLASEGGPDLMVADWTRVVGVEQMRGFAFANTPDRPVTTADTLRLGGRTMVIVHPGDAHSAGDLMLWLPAERVLFTGDIILEDGVTMVIDGSARALLATLDTIDALDPAVLVPGHGRIGEPPDTLVGRTRAYITALRDEMRRAVEQGRPMTRALRSLPPADSLRAVSYNSRRRRNAARVYVEVERAFLGLGADSTGGR